MHIDLDQAPADARFQSTVCILGGGIAGLILATRLAAAGVEVHLVEAGGLEPEQRSQALYEVEQAATPHRGASEGRFRTFGGSSTQWGGQLLPFTTDIFSPGEGVPSRPWPVPEPELTPHYEFIQELFATDRLSFEASLLAELSHKPVPFSSDIRLRYSKWAPFKKRNVARTLGPQALQHARITVITHGNVASLQGDGRTITEAQVLDYSGRAFRFEARHFVVAAGTVESSRILLSSPGVPNPHDQLGRCFHDHLSFHAAEFESPAREEMIERFGPFFVRGTLHTAKLEASATARAREHLLAVMAHTVVLEPEDSGAAAVRNLLRSVQSGRFSAALAENLPAVLGGAGDVGRLLYAARVQKRRAISKRARVMLNVDVEQVQDPNNCIRLSANRDALGLRKAIVDWRIHPDEFASARQFARIVRSELRRLGLTSLKWHASVNDGSDPPLVDTYHAMGGLCMGADPETSVVDANLKLHQLENLHVASCAVFPSGSSSNPTFTMMALTLRLADRLRALLA